MSLLEFYQLRFKPALLPNPSSPPLSFASTLSPLLATPGVSGVYIGPALETPGLFLAVVRWASPSAHDAFVASSASTEWSASLRALLVHHPLTNRAEFAGDVDAVLGAPTMEVCTAWGADDGFLRERMEPFARAVDGGRLEGYHGSAWGEFVQDEQDDNEVVAGAAVRLILGWDSREAHLQHKGTDSVIDQNIEYIRGGRKQFGMFHVSLTKL